MKDKQKIGIGAGLILSVVAIVFILLGYDKNTRNRRLVKIQQFFMKGRKEKNHD
ncbi:hypothetical protein KAU09_02075 [Candidatus Parcubacteria bacterium]|nr:hypothetical protein [Candidatus Parcubacteria bacterium]